MVRLLADVFSSGFENIRLLVTHSGFTVELVDAIRAKGGVDRAIRALHREFFPTEAQQVRDTPPVDADKNPYELPLEVQLAALRRANDEEGWGIPVEEINRLAETAPEWPKGRLAFRSLRIRFGEGDEGVAKTFEAHAKRVNAVFGHKVQIVVPKKMNPQLKKAQKCVFSFWRCKIGSIYASKKEEHVLNVRMEKP